MVMMESGDSSFFGSIGVCGMKKNLVVSVGIGYFHWWG